MAYLNLKIVFIGFRADLDFFHLNNGLFLLGLLGPLVLLVFEFPKIHDLANRRISIGSHFDKI